MADSDNNSIVMHLTANLYIYMYVITILISSLFFCVLQTLFTKESMPNTVILSSNPARPQRYRGILSGPLHRGAVFHILLHGGNQSPVSSCQSSEEAVLEISYKVYDVVSETRWTKNNNWWVRTGMYVQNYVCMYVQTEIILLRR